MKKLASKSIAVQDLDAESVVIDRTDLNAEAALAADEGTVVEPEPVEKFDEPDLASVIRADAERVARLDEELRQQNAKLATVNRKPEPPTAPAGSAAAILQTASRQVTDALQQTRDAEAEAEQERLTKVKERIASVRKTVGAAVSEARELVQELDPIDWRVLAARAAKASYGPGMTTFPTETVGQIKNTYAHLTEILPYIAANLDALDRYLHDVVVSGWAVNESRDFGIMLDRLEGNEPPLRRSVQATRRAMERLAAVLATQPEDVVEEIVASTKAAMKHALPGAAEMYQKLRAEDEARARHQPRQEFAETSYDIFNETGR